MRKFFVAALAASAGAGMLGSPSAALAAPASEIPFTWLQTVEGMGELIFTENDRPTNSDTYTYDLNGTPDAVMSGLLDQVSAHGGYECTDNPPSGDTHTINTCNWTGDTTPEDFIYTLRVVVATDGTDSPTGAMNIAQVGVYHTPES